MNNPLLKMVEFSFIKRSWYTTPYVLWTHIYLAHSYVPSLEFRLPMYDLEFFVPFENKAFKIFLWFQGQWWRIGKWCQPCWNPPRKLPHSRSWWSDCAKSRHLCTLRKSSGFDYGWILCTMVWTLQKTRTR